MRRPGLAAASLAVTAACVTALVGAPSAGAAGCPAPGGSAVPEASATGDVVFRGHGWGHGLGMSQYGAQGAAKLGCSATQILSAYYRGATPVAASMPKEVRLRMLDNGGGADVVAESGAVTWQLVDATGAHGVLRQPRGATYRLLRDAARTKFRIVDVGTGSNLWVGGGTGQKMRLYHSGTVVHLTTLKWNSAAAAYRTSLDRRLRWDYTEFTYDATMLDAQQVILDNTFGTAMQKYLWGIAEMPILFPAEALKAQAIAARTYAARLRGGSVSRPLMPTPADQNYTGYAHESADAHYGQRWKAAVDATAGKVLKNSTGAYVLPYYSSSMGGYSEDVRYVGWSSTAVPYLAAVDDSRWEMASSNTSAYRSWARGASWSTVAGRLGFSEVSSLSVAARGTSARLPGLTVTGIRNGSLVTAHVSGWDARQAFGLLSPGFTVTMRTIGGAAAQPIVGDWDGDGDKDPGWFQNGRFALSMNGRWTHRLSFGMAGDIAVVGDWDNNGVDDIGVFRAGRWYLRTGLSSGAPSLSFHYGTTGDRPVVGKWNGKTLGVGVMRSSRWYLRQTLSGGPTQVTFWYGAARDVPVAGDWDGDGDATVGVVRGTRWYERRGLSSGGSTSFSYGSPGDRPLAGDWNRDGVATPGGVRGRSFLLRNSNSAGDPTRTVAFNG